MSVFLILCSLGVAFYLMLLVALYREGRERRRQRAELCQEMDFGNVSEPLSDGIYAAVATVGRPVKFSDEVLWLPPTKTQWKPVSRMPLPPQPKPVSQAATDPSVHPVKFG